MARATEAENKEFFRRYVESVLNEGRHKLLSDFILENAVDHNRLRRKFGLRNCNPEGGNGLNDPSTALAALDVLVGEWALEARFDGAPSGDSGARVAFEWLSGETFLVQRWTVPIPEAADGVALIGEDTVRGSGYLQHYFDSRGVARLYRMSLEDNVWKLWREEPDFSPLHFRQRFTGTISNDGRTIDGTWDICHDGSTWERDFDLGYRKLS